jgi:hypothetical protein
MLGLKDQIRSLEDRVTAKNIKSAAYKDQLSWMKEEEKQVWAVAQDAQFKDAVSGSDPNQNWKKVSAAVENKTKEQCQSHFKLLQFQEAERKRAAEEAAAKEKARVEAEDEKARIEAERLKVKAEGWTTKQQRSLEKALTNYPASLPAKERWSKISGDVFGKTLKQCVARFKMLKQSIVDTEAAAAKEAASAKEARKFARKEKKKTTSVKDWGGND